MGIGYILHAGMVIVADGTPEAAARRLQRVLTSDPGMGVVRHADAGYPEAIECARERGVDLPMAAGVSARSGRRRPLRFSHRLAIMKRFAAELALLAAAVAAPLLPRPGPPPPSSPSPPLWLALRPPRREVWIAGVALARGGRRARRRLGGGARPARRRCGLRARAPQRHYARLWNSLWSEAKAAAATLAPLVPESGRDLDRAARIDAFRRLAQLEVGAGGGRHGLLLVDSDGAAVAWAGEGLLHELKPEAMPRAGPAFAAGWSAATLLAVEPLDGSRRPWRVIAGASFPTRELPFGRHEPLRWSLVARSARGRPARPSPWPRRAPRTLVVARRSLEPPPPDAPPPHWRLRRRASPGSPSASPSSPSR